MHASAQAVGEVKAVQAEQHDDNAAVLEALESWAEQLVEACATMREARCHIAGLDVVDSAGICPR